MMRGNSSAVIILTALCAAMLTSPALAQTRAAAPDSCPPATAYVATTDSARDEFVSAVAAIRPAGPTGDLLRISAPADLPRPRNAGSAGERLAQEHWDVFSTAGESADVKILIQIAPNGRVTEAYVYDSTETVAWNELMGAITRELVFRPVRIAQCPVSVWMVLDQKFVRTSR